MRAGCPLLPVRLVLAAMLAAWLLAGCSDTPSDSKRAIYHHVLQDAPGSLDPAHAGNVYAATLSVNLYDTLYRYKYLARPHELAPNLAAGMPEISDDGRVYIIRLRDDARFIDDPAFPGQTGRTVVAGDVIYSLKRHFHPSTRSQGAWLWRDRIVGLDDWANAGADFARAVPGLRALDTHTVRVELHEPYPQFPHTLAMALSAIVPKEAVDFYGRSFGVNPVGSGPFRLVDRDETKVVLEPHPGFDRGPLDLAGEGFSEHAHARYGLASLDGQDYPFVDRIVVHFINEPTARWSTFLAGQVDTVMVPPDQARGVLVSNDPPRFSPHIADRYHTLIKPEAGFVFYGFNMDNPEIGYNDDPQREAMNHGLRCAMRDAFDWSSRNNTFYHGLGQVFPGVIPPFLAEYDARLSTASIEFRPESGRQRLARHGWKAGSLPRLTYGLEANIHQRQMFEQFRAQMLRIGIPGEVFQPAVFATFGEMVRAIDSRQLDVFFYAWTMSYPDAQYSLQLFYGPNAAPGANSFNYANPEFDRLFEQASSMLPGPERTALYHRLNEMIIDDCVIIGSLSRTRVHLWRQNILMAPNGGIGAGYFLRFVGMETASR